MARTVIVVIDGFGIGAMPDAGVLRPGDLAADTCGHVLDHARAAFGRPLRLPVLEALGLGLVHEHPDLARRTGLPVAAGRAALGYPGADTFAGHQTMMGATSAGWRSPGSATTSRRWPTRSRGPGTGWSG